MTLPAAARQLAPAALAALLAGCSAVDRAPGRPTFEVLVSRTPDPAATVRAGELEPMGAGRQRWQRTDATEPFEVRTEPVGEGVTRTDPRGTRTLRVTPDGSVGLVSQRDAADGAMTIFDPPLPLAPPALHAGEEPAASARITTERAGTRADDGGHANRTVRIAAVERIRTPLGEFDAVRVDAVFAMKMAFASLRRETSTWIRPGDGPVAVRSDERILVMGIVPRNTAETRVRLPGGGGAP
jgi:hypothetical protein